MFKSILVNIGGFIKGKLRKEETDDYQYEEFD